MEANQILNSVTENQKSRKIRLGGILFLVVLALVGGGWLGWQVLNKPTGWFDSTGLVQILTVFMAESWPRVPRWFGDWGGGQPFFVQAEWLPLWFLAGLIRNGMSFAEALPLTAFLIVPLFGLAVGLVGYLLTRRWLIANLAVVFTFLSPETWRMVSDPDWLVVGLGGVFAAWSLVLVLAALNSRRRFFWLLASLVLGLTWLTSPSFGVVVSIAFLPIMVGGRRVEDDWLGSVVRWFLTVLIGLLLASWWLIPHWREGVSLWPALRSVGSVEWRSLIGFETIAEMASFSRVVVVWAAAGVLISWSSRRLRSLVWLGLVSFLALTWPQFGTLSFVRLVDFWYLNNLDFSLIWRFCLPILASVGLVGLAGLVGHWLVVVVFKKGQASRSWLVSLVSGIFLTCGLGVIFLFPIRWGFGPLFKTTPPSFVEFEEAEDFFGLEEDLAMVRIAFVPDDSELALKIWQATGIQLSFSPLGNDKVQMTAWWQECWLNRRLCGPKEIADLISWYDPSLIVVDQNQVKQSAELVLTGHEDFLYREIALGQDKIDLYEAVPVSSVIQTTQPTILVIGDNPPNNDVYDTLYRLMPRLGYGYDQALSVHGNRFVDDYTLEGLNHFDLVILHGYQLRDEERGWPLLARYVGQGGRLLINTGWRDVSQDWGRVKLSGGEFEPLSMPDLFPVSETIWGDLGRHWPELNSNLGEIDASNWRSLTWGDGAWQMGLAQKSALRPGARSLLSSGDEIIVAEQNYGDGRVVWTGFNFFSHLLAERRPEEEAFLGMIFNRLIPQVTWSEVELVADQPSRERSVVKLNSTKDPSKILWRATVADRWQARFLGSDEGRYLTIYEAGPGWGLVFIPEGAKEVIFEYRASLDERVGMAMSLAGVILLGFGLVFNQFYFRFRRFDSQSKQPPLKRLKQSDLK